MMAMSNQPDRIIFSLQVVSNLNELVVAGISPVLKYTPYSDSEESIPDPDDIQMIHFLLEMSGRNQSDLVDIFGSESIVSEVLAGQHKLDREHIEGLSRLFMVSPDAFLVNDDLQLRWICYDQKDEAVHAHGNSAEGAIEDLIRVVRAGHLPKKSTTS
jgi:antitoxin component HigA of HigAB toxin-antitoxin module